MGCWKGYGGLYWEGYGEGGVLWRFIIFDFFAILGKQGKKVKQQSRLWNDGKFELGQKI